MATQAESPRRRLLFLSTVHPSPRAPTTGTFNATLLTALTEWWEVSAVAPTPWYTGYRPIMASMAPASYPVSSPRAWYIPGIAPGQRPRAMAAAFERGRRLLGGDMTPDIILSYWAHPDSDAAGQISARLGVPSAVIVGGSDVLLLAKREPMRRLISIALGRHAHVFAIGEEVAAAVEALGVPPDRISVYARGVDRHRFTPLAPAGDSVVPIDRSDTPSVLWVGRMVSVKDVSTLLAAMTHPRLTARRVRLVLIGTGPLRGALEREARDLGLKDRVDFAGPAAPQALPAYYRRATLVALPSLSEGTPNVLLEAAACGTPFVATAVGSVPSLARALDGVVVPTGQPAVLGEAIADLVEAPRSIWAPAPVIEDSRHAAAELSATLATLVRRAE